MDSGNLKKKIVVHNMYDVIRTKEVSKSIDKLPSTDFTGDVTLRSLTTNVFIRVEFC